MRRLHRRSTTSVLLGAAVTALTVAACSTADGIPATTPATTTTSASTTTTSAATTTTTAATTTTLDRLTEIEAIFRDLEERRLDALYRKDEAAFRELFANEAYMEEDLASFDQIIFVAKPDPVLVSLSELLYDSESCIAARLAVDYRGFFGPDALGDVAVVIEPQPEGDWGFSYAGSGWACEGPHPLGGNGS